MAKKKKNTIKKKKTSNLIIYCIVVSILFFIACLNGRVSTLQKGEFAASDAEFQVHVIDVDQADSILVIADGEAMLIDAGESGAGGVIQQYLDKCSITELKYAVATHMHADHIGGFPIVLQGIKAETVLEPVYADSLVPTTRVYERYLEAVDANGAQLHAAQAGETFALGGATITVLGPVGVEEDDVNNTSLVLRVDYGEVSCLFTGDMEEPAEKELLQSSADLNVDFLKVGHHGAATSSSEAFLAAVTPQYAAISCGKDNDYGHPAEVTMNNLGRYAQEIHITAEEGSLVFSYDKDSGTCNFVTENGAENSTQAAE